MTSNLNGDARAHYPSAKALADALKGVRQQNGFMARCPAHDDATPSLSIRDEKGKTLVRCHAGCSQGEVLDALRERQLWPDQQAARTIAATYDYRDEHGELLFQTVRYVPKDFRQRRPDGGGGWIWSIKGVRCIPYRLRELNKAIGLRQPVLVVEGEKDCDSLAKLGIAATCNAAGAKKWKAEHSAFLRGADVVICPDNDDSGREHAEIVAASLNGIAARIRILALPNLAEKGDVSAWLAAGNQPSRLLSLIENAPDWQAQTANNSGNSRNSSRSNGYGHNSGDTSPLDDPTPLFRPLPPGTPFPTDALGPIIGPVVYALHEGAVQAPISMCASGALAAAAISTQAHGNVTLPHGETVPLSLFLLVIAESGERKSSLHKRVLDGVTRHTKELEATSKEELFRHRVGLAAWEAEKRIIGNDKKLDFEARKMKLEKLGAEPVPPRQPFVMVKEPTVQGLEKVMIAGQHSIGLFTSEAGEFLGGHSMGKERITGTLAKLNSLWDGDGVERIRAGEEPVICRDRRLSIFFQVQPHLSAQALTHPIVRDIGFLSRLLICRPDSAIGTRFGSELTEKQTHALLEFSTRSFRLMRRPPPLADDGSLQLPNLTFTEDAGRALTLFNHFVEKEMAEGGSFEPIRGFASKLGQHAARIAAVMLLFEDHDAQEIGPEHLQRGIDIALFYASEACRLQGVAEIDPELLEAHSLLEWMLSKWKGGNAISVTEIVQFGPNAIRDAGKVRDLLGTLESNGHVGPAERADVRQPDGKINRRREAHRIIGRA